MVVAYPFTSSIHAGICDVSAVPGEKVVDASYSGGSDMVCVSLRADRQRPAHNQRLRENHDRRMPGNDRDPRECGYASTRHEHLPTACFCECRIRCEQPKITAPVLPPVAGLALALGHDGVAAGAGDQVADDARFDVHGGRHGSTLTTRSTPHNRARKSRSAVGLKRCGGAPLGRPRSKAARDVDHRSSDVPGFMTSTRARPPTRRRNSSGSWRIRSKVS